MNNKELLKEKYTEVYNFIVNTNLDLLPLGRYALTQGIYVNIEEYRTEFRSERKFESHRLYTDIQYMINGEELIALSDTSKLKSLGEYNQEKDIEFYDNSIDGIDHYIGQGDYLIIDPLVAHMPCICVGEREIVRKAVFKIPNMSE